MSFDGAIGFQGPYRLFGDNSLFSAFPEEFSGVYVWCIDAGDRVLPYYVGMSEQVLYRTREHIRLHMTGSYWVYDAESLADARKSVIYKPMSTDEALAIGIDFYRTARSQLERTCLIVAPIDVDRAWLLRVESALIRELAAEPNLSRIQDNGGVSKRTAEGDRVDIPISLPDVVALTLEKLSV